MRLIAHRSAERTAEHFVAGESAACCFRTVPAALAAACGHAPTDGACACACVWGGVGCLDIVPFRFGGDGLGRAQQRHEFLALHRTGCMRRSAMR